MIKEVAIEPEVMATWNHFWALWDNLGASRGRLVAEYPSNWRELVCKRAYEISSVKALKITLRLKPSPGQGGVKRWISTNRNYDKGKDWLNNAEKFVNPENFAAVVALKNPRSNDRVLVAGEFDKEAKPWAAPTQNEVSRTAAIIAGCANVLLRASNELVLVEPNFDASEKRFQDSLKALSQCRNHGRPWNRLELHVKFPTDKDGRDFPDALPNRIHSMARHLAPLIPSGNCLNVFFWQRKPDGKKMHPRFILTELGGLQPDYGLDEGDAPGDMTIVSLMSEEVWRTARADYCEASQCFDGGPDCVAEIVGKA
jgi:hypothetical protein